MTDHFCNRLLTLSPRNGLGYYVVFLYKVKGDNHNSNNNSYYFTELDFFVFTFYLFVIPTDIEKKKTFVLYRTHHGMSFVYCHIELFFPIFIVIN